MKKKIIATLLVGVVLSVGIMGLTACDGGTLTLNKGKEVTEEEWIAAFTASIEAKNFTYDYYLEDEVKEKGSINEEIFGVSSIDMNVKQTLTTKAYYDLENYTYYTKTTHKGTSSGVPEKMHYRVENYVHEKYVVKDGNKFYEAEYNMMGADEGWFVYSPERGYSYYNIMEDRLKSYTERYNDFTYSDGVYTLTRTDEDNVTEHTVSVSIKGGYVVGFSGSHVKISESEDYESRNIYKEVFNFSAYGSTTVKPSKEAKKAVEDYKNT